VKSSPRRQQIECVASAVPDNVQLDEGDISLLLEKGDPA